MWLFLYWFPVLAGIGCAAWIVGEIRALRSDQEVRNALSEETLEICRTCGRPIYYATGSCEWWDRYPVRPGQASCKDHIPVGVDPPIQITATHF